MAFHIDTRDIPVLKNYERAAALEGTIIPIRGGTCKPLTKSRRKQHMNIRREGELIKVRLHSTDVVTFYPDGLIEVRMGGWNSISTRLFLQEVLGTQVGTSKSTPYIRCSWHAEDKEDKRDKEDPSLSESTSGYLPLRTYRGDRGGSGANYFRWETKPNPSAPDLTYPVLTYQNPIFRKRRRVKLHAAAEEYKNYEEFKGILAAVGRLYSGEDMRVFNAALQAAGGRIHGAKQLLAAARGRAEDKGEQGATQMMRAAFSVSRGSSVREKAGYPAYEFNFVQVWAGFRTLIVQNDLENLTYEEEVRDGRMV